MLVAVDHITITHRIRRDLGDLSGLMDSLQTHGLINPVMVTRGFQLIAGHRRLESARRLGWETIEVIVVDRPSDVAQLEIEIEENLHRRDLTEAELAAARARLERLRHPGFFRRLWQKITAWRGRLFSRRRPADS